MKTKLKEALIGLATDGERYQKFKKRLIIPIMIAAFFLLLFNVPAVLTRIWLFVAVAALLIFKIVEAIEQNKLIIDRNKLRYIILSSENVWYYGFLFCIVYPLFILIVSVLDVLVSIISFIILIFAIFLLSRVFSKHFDKKLKKIEYFH